MRYEEQKRSEKNHCHTGNCLHDGRHACNNSDGKTSRKPTRKSDDSDKQSAVKLGRISV